MKNMILLIATVLLYTSCSSDKNNQLIKQIDSLESANKTLRDSIYKMGRDKILTSSLILIPEMSKAKVNEPNRYMAVFSQVGKFPKYDVYEVTKDTEGNEERTMNQKGNTEAKFFYEFTPKSKLDNKIYLIAEFEKDTINNETPLHYVKSTVDIE